MRFDYCIACSLALVHFAAAGPVLQRSQNLDLSPLMNAANVVSSLPPEKDVAISAAARQKRGMIFDHSNGDRRTRTETVVVTRQPPQPAPPQTGHPPRPNDTSKPPVIMSFKTVSSKIAPVIPGTQDTPRETTSSPKTAIETIRASKAHSLPASTNPVSPFPFSFPWSLPLSWLRIPGIDLDINSIVSPALSTILPQATDMLAWPTGTTTTIQVTKTFMTTITMTLPEPAPVPTPAPVPPEINSKKPQLPLQHGKERQMMTTTVYVTVCNPAYSPMSAQGENGPSPWPAPPAPPAQVAPTEAPSREPAPPSPPDNPEPPYPTLPADAPSSGVERGGGGQSGGRDGGHGGGGPGGGGREGDGQGNGRGHDDDKGKYGAHVGPITVGGNPRGDGGGLIGVLTRAADDLLFN